MVYSFKNILWEVALSWRKSCKMHSWGPCFLTVSCLKQRKNIYKLRTENSGSQTSISLVFRVALVPELLTFQLFLGEPCWAAADHPRVMHRALLICRVTCEGRIQLQSPGGQQKFPQPPNLGLVAVNPLSVWPGRGLCPCMVAAVGCFRSLHEPHVMGSTLFFSLHLAFVGWGKRKGDYNLFLGLYLN